MKEPLTQADRDRLASAAMREALAEAIQVARNYYMLFHDETWKRRMEAWEAALSANREK